VTFPAFSSLAELLIRSRRRLGRGGRRDREAECLGSTRIHNKLKASRLNHREVSRVCSLQNAACFVSLDARFVELARELSNPCLEGRGRLFHARLPTNLRIDFRS